MILRKKLHMNICRKMLPKVATPIYMGHPEDGFFRDISETVHTKAMKFGTSHKIPVLNQNFNSEL